MKKFKMKTITKLSLATVLALGMTFSAQALSITPATANIATGNQTSQSQINTAIAPLIGSATELYKQNVGGPEVGSLAGSYTTTFNNTPLDPADATITYNGGSIVGPTAYLLVKDGNQTPAWYLFDLTALGWDGIDTLNLTDFWPANGAISHVTLYGTTGPGTSVPDAGSTLALLGCAIGSIGLIRRKLCA
jgi:hypothetical protein